MERAEVLAKLHALLRVHQLDVAVGVMRAARDGCLSRIAYGGRTHLTFLRCHDNHTIGGSRTIDGRCRRISQDVDTLDILRVDTRNGVTDIVDIVGVVELLRANVHGVLQHKSVEHP